MRRTKIIYIMQFSTFQLFKSLRTIIGQMLPRMLSVIRHNKDALRSTFDAKSILIKRIADIKFLRGVAILFTLTAHLPALIGGSNVWNIVTSINRKNLNGQIVTTALN